MQALATIGKRYSSAAIAGRALLRQLDVIRIMRGVSTEEWSKQAGVALSAVKKTKAGVNGAHLTTAVALADALGMDLVLVPRSTDD